MNTGVGDKLGLEMEMGVVNRSSGASHPVRSFFTNLAELKLSRGEKPILTQLEGRCVGLTAAAGYSGLDNGFNLLETSFAPVSRRDGGLQALSVRVHRELADIIQALRAEDAFILNASEHPACSLDPDWYNRVYVPRPIYRELIGHRGWLHRAGIDAKAQNSPCVSVPVRDAARTLNVVLALAPASIAVFANSPVAYGRETGLKEHRLTLWDRVFRHARYAGDHDLQRLPERPFEGLGDYFRWMFGGRTVSRFLPGNDEASYKSVLGIEPLGAPSLAQILSQTKWPGRCADTGSAVTIVPDGTHFVYSQFAQFLDARWRYCLAQPLSLVDLQRTWHRPGELESLFDALGVEGYIEGRAPAAVFADRDLLQRAGNSAAHSVVLAPLALQLGLMRNLDASEQLCKKWGWLRLRALRSAAMRQALSHDEIHALSGEVLTVAHAGLEREEQSWLDYALYVWRTRRTAADVMLSRWRQLAGQPDRLIKFCRAQEVIVVNEL